MCHALIKPVLEEKDIGEEKNRAITVYSSNLLFCVISIKTEMLVLSKPSHSNSPMHGFSVLVQVQTKDACYGGLSQDLVFISWPRELTG